MKPLTIDELKTLQIGDWIWVEHETYGNTYALIDDCDVHRVALDTLSFEGWLSYKNYGKTWIAYKNKEQAKGDIT